MDRHDLTVVGPDLAFAVFDEQDSGCLSYGIGAGRDRWFVKRGTTPEARATLARAVAFHRAVRHPAIVALYEVLGEADDPVLVYPWCDGVVLNQATLRGPDRTGLARFRSLPRGPAIRAISRVIDAHIAVAAAGFVAVDLYDGCLLYDFATDRMNLIDLDEYRPGPFVVQVDRLPGSRTYMAPEEFVRGAVIDERTTVFNLGRLIRQLLDGPTGWRGTAAHEDVVARATAAPPARRFQSVVELAGAWAATRRVAS